MEYKYYSKQMFKWLVLVPVAAILDLLTYIVKGTLNVLDMIQDSYSDTFERLVQWCDKR